MLYDMQNGITRISGLNYPLILVIPFCIRQTPLSVVALEDWEGLIEWLETLEDIQIAKQFLTQLKSHQGNRERAGWL